MAAVQHPISLVVSVPGGSSEAFGKHGVVICGGLVVSAFALAVIMRTLSPGAPVEVLEG